MVDFSVLLKDKLPSPWIPLECLFCFFSQFMNYFIQIQVIKEVEAPTTVVFNLLFTIGKQGLGGHILCADLSSYLLSLLNLSNL